MKVELSCKLDSLFKHKLLFLLIKRYHKTVLFFNVVCIVVFN